MTYRNRFLDFKFIKFENFSGRKVRFIYDSSIFVIKLKILSTDAGNYSFAHLCNIRHTLPISSGHIEFTSLDSFQNISGGVIWPVSEGGVARQHRVEQHP